jgi:hypothetical protein
MPQQGFAPIIILMPEMPQGGLERLLTRMLQVVALSSSIVFSQNRQGARIVELA